MFFGKVGSGASPNFQVGRNHMRYNDMNLKTCFMGDEIRSNEGNRGTRMNEERE